MSALVTHTYKRVTRPVLLSLTFATAAVCSRCATACHLDGPKDNLQSIEAVKIMTVDLCHLLRKNHTDLHNAQVEQILFYIKIKTGNWRKLFFFSFLQSTQFKVHKRKASRLVWPLPGSEIHPNQTSLVVEGQSSVWPIDSDQESHWYGTLLGGGSLCRARFPTCTQAHGRHLQAELREMQRSFTWNLSENVQLLCRRDQEGNELVTARFYVHRKEL